MVSDQFLCQFYLGGGAKNSKSPVIIINAKGQFEKYWGLEQDFQIEGETYFVFVERKRRKEKGWIQLTHATKYALSSFFPWRDKGLCCVRVFCFCFGGGGGVDMLNASVIE